MCAAFAAGAMDGSTLLDMTGGWEMLLLATDKAELSDELYDSGYYLEGHVIKDTHAHPDHYTPDTVLDYVRHNRVGRVFLPAAGGAEHDRLVSWLRDRQVPTRILEHDMEKPHTYFLKKELHLTAAGVPHMKTSWPDSVCNCVVLTACGENTVFLSDCDLQSEAYYSFLKAAHITAAFVNPYFFHDCAGRKILQEIIAPDCLFIYHMPFANEDKTGLRGLVRQDMKKYGDSFARIEVLVEQEQTAWVGE